MGRRISPKTWDRIVEFLEVFGLSVAVQKLLWAVVWNLCIKFYFGEYNTGNG